MSQQDVPSAIARNEAMQLFLGAAGAYDPLVLKGLKLSHTVLKKYQDEEDIREQSLFKGDDSGPRTR